MSLFVNRATALLAALISAERRAQIAALRTPLVIASERELDVVVQPDVAHAPPRLLAIV